MAVGRHDVWELNTYVGCTFSTKCSFNTTLKPEMSSRFFSDSYPFCVYKIKANYLNVALIHLFFRKLMRLQKCDCLKHLSRF